MFCVLYIRGGKKHTQWGKRESPRRKTPAPDATLARVRFNDNNLKRLRIWWSKSRVAVGVRAQAVPPT